MPRASKTKEQALPEITLVIDNGGYTIKTGFASSQPDVDRDCKIIPNCIARGTDARRQPHIYIADQLDACKDFAEMTFRRPVEKGYIVNWDSELDIWKEAFFHKNAKLHCDPHETNLIMSEAPNCPQGLQHNTDQMIFEECQFASAYRSLGPTLASANVPTEALLIIDSGYSHTTITPILRGRPVNQAIRRLDIGGKLLTNRLKELISLRQFNLMDESHLVSQIKEDTCYISRDFQRDLQRSWKATTKPSTAHSGTTGEEPIVLEYVLPDYHNTSRGHIRPYNPRPKRADQHLAPSKQHESQEDSFPLANERFTVPELLFSPSDVSLSQAGLPEVIIQSLSVLPAALWPALLANVVCIGGNALIPGFVERLEDELRCLSPAICSVRVERPDDPVAWTWSGGVRLAIGDGGWERYRNLCVTRAEYEEFGGGWAARKLAGGE